ncbi:MAG: inorganic pyrophosphatase [Anaerolineales bacterium]|nr:inorganic pyrophosphatase [Anaerolineales bacterium]
MLGILYRSHPWHGIPIGEKQPDVLNVYIEIVPQDTVKYELDKYTGILKVDRPQSFSNVCPTLYGLIPQTLCSDTFADYCMARTGREGIVGDDDPLDICVLTEKVIPRGDILLQAIPIGGLRMIDGGEADDKIIAVLKGDAVYGRWTDIADCPQSVIDRLRHYFLTYKQEPGKEQVACEIVDVYGRSEAKEVIQRAYNDYMVRFSDIEGMLSAALRS